MQTYFNTHLKPYFPLTQEIHDLLTSSLKACKIRIFQGQLKSLHSHHNKQQDSISKSLQQDPTRKDPSELYLDDLVKKQFLLRLNHEKKERKLRAKAELEERNKKIEEELEKQKNLEIQAKEKQKEDKIRMILERQEKLSTEKKERFEIIEKSNKELRKVASVKPLFKEIEERFQHSFELPELENRKKELAKKRQIFAPMNLKDIFDHTKYYEEHLDLMSGRRKQRILENQREQLVNLSCNNLYRAKIFDLAQESDREKNEIIQMKQLQKKVLTEKSKRYGELVKELFKPVIRINKSVEKPVAVETPAKLVHVMPPRKVSLRKSVKDPPEKNSTSTRTKSTKVGINRLHRIPSIEEKKPEIFDYLAEQRKLRQENKQIKVRGWKDIGDQGLKPEQKLEKIRSQVHLLENQAKSYEMLKSNDIYASQYLNQSYVEAIRAKLAYLNELSNL